MHNLWQAFASTVKRVPLRPAIIIGEEEYSFDDWARRADDFRCAYLSEGVLPGDRILLWVSNTFDIAAALTGAWGVDAIPVLMDSGCRSPQLVHALETVGPRLIIAEEGSLDASAPNAPKMLRPEDVVSAGQVCPLPGTKALPTDPASIIFTSGSTGKPKGVVQSHANLLRGCQAVFSYLELTDVDRLLCPVPWSFDYGYGQLITSIAFGITHVIPIQQNPFGICDAITKHSPSILMGTPAVYSYLIGGMSPVGSIDVSTIQLLTSTGGNLHVKVRARLLEVFREARLVLNYGLTESYRSCYLPATQTAGHQASIGVPIPGVDIVIIREDGEPADTGEHGEIVHRGDYIFLGYWGDPQASAKAIRPDPLLPSRNLATSRALYTGDIGYRDEDGYFHYVGRRDHQLKSMGVRVSPGEVEAILLDSGLIKQTGVFGLPHETLGHEVWAAIVPMESTNFILREVEKYARSNMSQYMLPRRYLVLDELPRTTTGKTDYQALADMAREASV